MHLDSSTALLSPHFSLSLLQTLTALSGCPAKPWRRSYVSQLATPTVPPRLGYTPMSTSSAPRSTGTTRPSPSNGGSKTNNKAKICEGSMGRARLPPPQPLRRSMGHRNPLHDFTRIQSKNRDQNQGHDLLHEWVFFSKFLDCQF